MTTRASRRLDPRAPSRLRIACVALTLVLISGAPASAARQDTTAADRLNALVDAARAGEPVAGQDGPGPPPSAQQGVAGAPTALALAYADSVALEQYATWAIGHRTRVFEWQHLSSRIIFFAVLFLVLTGVGFSGVQFYRSMREPLRVSGGKEQEGGSSTSHIELSTGGLKISSPVLGVIILGLSLAFFYLYLVYVYPISETF